MFFFFKKRQSEWTRHPRTCHLCQRPLIQEGSFCQWCGADQNKQYATEPVRLVPMPPVVQEQSPCTATGVLKRYGGEGERPIKTLGKAYMQGVRWVK